MEKSTRMATRFERQTLIVKCHEHALNARSVVIVV